MCICYAGVKKKLDRVLPHPARKPVNNCSDQYGKNRNPDSLLGISARGLSAFVCFFDTIAEDFYPCDGAGRVEIGLCDPNPYGRDLAILETELQKVFRKGLQQFDMRPFWPGRQVIAHTRVIHDIAHGSAGPVGPACIHLDIHLHGPSLAGILFPKVMTDCDLNHEIFDEDARSMGFRTQAYLRDVKRCPPSTYKT